MNALFGSQGENVQILFNLKAFSLQVSTRNDLSLFFSSSLSLFSEETAHTKFESNMRNIHFFFARFFSGRRRRRIILLYL
jgi:hypothetical protein